MENADEEAEPAKKSRKPKAKAKSKNKKSKAGSGKGRGRGRGRGRGASTASPEATKKGKSKAAAKMDNDDASLEAPKKTKSKAAAKKDNADASPEAPKNKSQAAAKKDNADASPEAPKNKSQAAAKKDNADASPEASKKTKSQAAAKKDNADASLGSDGLSADAFEVPEEAGLEYNPVDPDGLLAAHGNSKVSKKVSKKRRMLRLMKKPAANLGAGGKMADADVSESEEKPASPESVPKKVRRSSKATGKDTKGDDSDSPTKKTFARRYRPSTESFALYKWLALKLAFETVIEEKVSNPSQHEVHLYISMFCIASFDHMLQVLYFLLKAPKSLY